MTTSGMIRELCDRMNISLAELCRRVDRHRRILIRSCSVVPYPLRKWRRLQRRWMLDMSRHLCCRMEKNWSYQILPGGSPK